MFTSPKRTKKTKTTKNQPNTMKTKHTKEIKNVKVICTRELEIFNQSFTKNKLYDAKKYEESSYNIQGFSIKCNENTYFNFGQMDFKAHFIELKKLRKEKLKKINQTR